MRPDRGFTLIEMMVTIAVMAIIAGIAFPNLRDFVVNNRVSTQTNEFVAVLNFARSEAIKRGADVRVCAEDGKDFGRGWLVRPGDSCDDDDEVLVRHEALTDFGLKDQECAWFTFNGRGGLGEDVPESCKPPSGTPDDLKADRAVLKWASSQCDAGTQRVRWVSVRGSGRIAVARGDCE